MHVSFMLQPALQPHLAQEKQKQLSSFSKVEHIMRASRYWDWMETIFNATLILAPAVIFVSLQSQVPVGILVVTLLALIAAAGAIAYIAMGLVVVFGEK